MSGAVKPCTEGIYRRVSVRMYGDEKFSRLTPLQPSGQALWIYLLTGPHTGPVPGLFVIGRAALAEILGWDEEAFSKAFAEVFAEGLVEFDAKSRLWFIPKAIRHNMPANPNVVRSWRGPLALMPECDLRERAMACISAALFSLSDAFGRAFEEACGKALPKSLPKTAGKASPKQEQEQEQKQDRDTSRPRRLARSSDSGTRLPSDWALSEELRSYCKQTRPDLDPDSVAENFRDFWVAKPGKDARKLDWPATFRRWVREQRSAGGGFQVRGGRDPMAAVDQFAGGV